MSSFTRLIPILFLLSCGQGKQDKIATVNDPLAHKFNAIDGKLKDFAFRHNGKINTVWAKMQLSGENKIDSYPVKHIVWSEGSYNFAIIMQPHSDITGVDSNAWDFSNITWLDKTYPNLKTTQPENLLTKVSFDVIEHNIDKLLIKSEENFERKKIRNVN